MFLSIFIGIKKNVQGYLKKNNVRIKFNPGTQTTIYSKQFH